MTRINSDEKAVLEALKHVGGAPFTEFSRLCAERDKLEALEEKMRAHFALDEDGKPTKWMYYDDFERILQEVLS